MPSRRRLLRLSIVLLAWSLSGASLVHALGRFVAPVSGASLEAGASVRVSWDLPEAEAGRFEEMELLLSLDGGRTFPIRVTRDLDAGTHGVSFRVPLLPAQDARLALRAGDGNEPGAEEILLTSDSFSIEAGAGTPLEPTARVEGEWRTSEALDGSGAGRPWSPDCLAKDPSAIGSLPAMPPAAAPRGAFALTSDRFERACPEKPARPLPQAACPALLRMPTAAPLRL